jgi:uncharacterized Zn finger protein
VTAETVTGKAARYLAEGHVTIVRVDGDLVDARVRGDSGTYMVRHDPAGWWCSCPALGRCSHVVAVKLVTIVTTERDDRGAPVSRGPDAGPPPAGPAQPRPWMAA